MVALAELYETDFYAWTRHQARELRRLQETRPNIALDLEHLEEEVRDLGSDRRDACRSQVERILEHFLNPLFTGRAAPALLEAVDSGCAARAQPKAISKPAARSPPAASDSLPSRAQTRGARDGGVC
jgi:hypothetical protein